MILSWSARRALQADEKTWPNRPTEKTDVIVVMGAVIIGIVVFLLVFVFAIIVVVATICSAFQLFLHALASMLCVS